jgi:hypothetical protein
MMRKLFLDDSRKPPDFTWDVVKSYEQFIAYIKLHGVPDIISFDHDLGDEHYAVYQDTPHVSEGKAQDYYGKFQEKTGYDCAKWLVENNKLPKEFYVHSMNPVGALNIRFVMEGAYRQKGGVDMR